ncbi:MAG: hypothetical protein AAGE59_22020 [Cyanobacteria bacterium P01_F01_bin.86]
MNRLLLIYDLQAAGFLGQGDRWYLHTQLGHSQHQQANRFYQDFFKPLCHQGLGLPEGERPLPLQAKLGAIPYLGSRVFQTHPLEQQYPAIALPDEPFEFFLGWLAEQNWQRTFQAVDEPGIITRPLLAGAWEYLMTAKTGKAKVSSSLALQEVCAHTIDAYILQSLSHPAAAMDVLMGNLEDSTCHQLVETVLPTITILDLACGSGRLLLMAGERLWQLYQACWNYAQTSSHPLLQTWVRSLQNTKSTTAWTLKQRILTQNLYGLDLSPEAVDITQLQLWLALLSTATVPDDIAPLPDLDFSITTGNALVGFIRVDEAGFDKITSKRQRPTSQHETVLQGNLLQPLAAANYRDTLAERQIRVEHYRTQTKAMAEVDNIPEYVQTEFLRDRIDAVNQAAQQKLNRLLLTTMSQQFGIQVREPQPSGHPHKRLLNLADIEALQPFHWGFFFNTILEQRGGFDIILTHLPAGTLRPNTDEFYTEYVHLFQQHEIAPSAWRRSRKAILRQFPTFAKLWSAYAGRFSYLRDYFRRNHAYQLPSTPTATRSLPLKTLFDQRCAALLSPNGVPPYLHNP